MGFYSTRMDESTMNFSEALGTIRQDLATTEKASWHNRAVIPARLESPPLLARVLRIVSIVLAALVLNANPLRELQ